ncbi:ZDH16 Palmitoyltransferase, partial [Polypterus senegalus]
MRLFVRCFRLGRRRGQNKLIRRLQELWSYGRLCLKSLFYNSFTNSDTIIDSLFEPIYWLVDHITRWFGVTYYQTPPPPYTSKERIFHKCVIYLWVLCSSVALALGGLTLWHAMLISRGETSIERHINRKEQHRMQKKGKPLVDQSSSTFRTPSIWRWFDMDPLSHFYQEYNAGNLKLISSTPLCATNRRASKTVYRQYSALKYSSPVFCTAKSMSHIDMGFF